MATADAVAAKSEFEFEDACAKEEEPKHNQSPYGVGYGSAEAAAWQVHHASTGDPQNKLRFYREQTRRSFVIEETRWPPPQQGKDANAGA
jgi:hypothetical protein